MNLEWRQVGGAPAGGAILQIVGDPMQSAWAASPAGLFQAAQGAWSLARGGMPLAQVGAVLAVRRYVLAASLQGGAAFSLDGGASWQLSHIEQTQAPLSCLAASPNFWQDGVLLAGTQGDGVLRSTDSGRTWQLANFGLRSFTIFALVPAPTWGRREAVFVGAADGVYYSPNGGRAWKPGGLSQHAILSLAIGPNFDQDGTLLAGAEDGLFRSQDAGKTWAAVDLGLSPPPTVNALWFSPDGCAWMGTSEHGVWRSSDGGACWTALEGSPRSVLSLGGGAGRICAGTFDQGLVFSSDGGASWQPDAGLSARRFQWFVTLPRAFQPSTSGAAPTFLAGGALEGLWLVVDGGRRWQPLPGWSGEEPPLCLEADAAGVWAGDSHGVWRAARPAERFELSLDCGAAITALAGAEGPLWAGSLDGRLWLTQDGGRIWSPITSPAQGAELLALAAASDQVIAAVREPGQRLVHLYCGQLVDPLVPQVGWQRWLSESCSGERVHLARGGADGQVWLIALDNRWYHCTPAGAQRIEWPISAPPHALVWSPQVRAWLAAARDGLWLSSDLTDWQRLETHLPVEQVVAFQIIPTEPPGMAALTLDGRIWQWHQ
jgi:photosystem II stability/assembly factor-like uncharacterized protein